MNSDTNKTSWGRVWTLVLIVTLTTVGGWELLVRKAGLGPEYNDDRALWANARHRLNQHGDTAIALLGASRSQRGVDVATVSKAFGRPVVQLSVDGSSALATLENLAVDPRFRGSVVFSVAPAFTFSRFLPRVDNGRQREWLRYYLDQSQSRRLEQSLRLFLQGKLAFRSPDARLTRLVPEVIRTGELPERDQKTTFADRVTLYDYTKMPVEADELGMMQLYLKHTAPYKKEEFEATLNYFAALLAILKQKGVDVIFLQLPSGEQVGALESVFFPRTHFWDLMAARLDATFINSDDYPEMSGFMSSDGSHIASARILEFTEILVRILAANRLEAVEPPEV